MAIIDAFLRLLLPQRVPRFRGTDRLTRTSRRCCYLCCWKRRHRSVVRSGAVNDCCVAVCAADEAVRLFEPFVPHALRLCMHASGAVLIAAAEFLATAAALLSEDSHHQLLPYVLSSWMDIYGGIVRADTPAEV